MTKELLDKVNKKIVEFNIDKGWQSIARLYDTSTQNVKLDYKREGFGFIQKVRKARGKEDVWQKVRKVIEYITEMAYQEEKVQQKVFSEIVKLEKGLFDVLLTQEEKEKVISDAKEMLNRYEPQDLIGLIFNKYEKIKHDKEKIREELRKTNNPIIFVSNEDIQANYEKHLGVIRYVLDCGLKNRQMDPLILHEKVLNVISTPSVNSNTIGEVICYRFAQRVADENSEINVKELLRITKEWYINNKNVLIDIEDYDDFDTLNAYHYLLSEEELNAKKEMFYTNFEKQMEEPNVLYTLKEIKENIEWISKWEVI